jgi:G3E family GTPase
MTEAREVVEEVSSLPTQTTHRSSLPVVVVVREVIPMLKTLFFPRVEEMDTAMNKVDLTDPEGKETLVVVVGSTETEAEITSAHPSNLDQPEATGT